MGLRIIDDVIRQTELLGDRERVALSRNSDEELVGRTKCLDIELAACIFDTRSRQGKYL